MELIRVGEKTYYIKNPTNIGVYKISENEVFLIDAGNDKDAGKKILKLIEAEGWQVKGIITTHSNADHIGGNCLIQERTGCPVYACGIEKCFTEFPVLEPAFLYGGYPFTALKNKFLMAKPSSVTALDEITLPKGLSLIPLKGHFFDMIGIKTDDGVCFLADALFSKETISKYHLFVIYDVKGYLDTLDSLSALEGTLFIPSHCEATESVTALVAENRSKILEICDTILSLCQEEATLEDILAGVFDRYGLSMNVNQYVLCGSTVRSYLSYLEGEGRLSYLFRDNKMYWKQVLRN